MRSFGSIGIVCIAALLGFAICLLLMGCSANSDIRAVQPPESNGDEDNLVLDAILQTPTPEGVDEMLFSSLKNELVKSIQLQGSKEIGKAPNGDSNTITNFRINEILGSEVHLQWTYRNVGDYDRNGEVGISDLTPVGLHYGLEATPGSAATLADGDLNGIVNISDITPIGVHWQSSVAKYIVFTEGDNSEPEALGEVEFAAHTISEAGELTFSAVVDLEPGTTLWVAPIDSEDNVGRQSNTIQQPVPSLLINDVVPSSSAPGTIVELTPLFELTQEDSVAVAWGADEVPAVVNAAGNIVAVVPPISSGVIELGVRFEGGFSNSLSFTVTESEPANVVEVETAIDSMIIIVDLTLDPLMQDLALEDGLSPDKTQELSNLADVTTKILTELKDQLSEFNSTEQTFICTTLQSSGFLDCLSDLSEEVDSSKKSPSALGFSQTLGLKLDRASMKLHTASLGLLAGAGVSAFIPGIGIPTSAFLINAAAGVAIVKTLVDSATPCNLDSIIMPDLVVNVQESEVFTPMGVFLPESTVQQVVLSQLTGSLLKKIRPAGTENSPALEQVASEVKSFLEGLVGDTFSDLLSQFTSGTYILNPRTVPLMMSLYSSEPFGRAGFTPVFVDDLTIVSFNAETSELTGEIPGFTNISCQGLNWHDWHIEQTPTAEYTKEYESYVEPLEIESIIAPPLVSWATTWSATVSGGIQPYSFYWRADPPTNIAVPTTSFLPTWSWSANTSLGYGSYSGTGKLTVTDDLGTSTTVGYLFGWSWDPPS